MGQPTSIGAWHSRAQQSTANVVSLPPATPPPCTHTTRSQPAAVCRVPAQTINTSTLTLSGRPRPARTLPYAIVFSHLLRAADDNAWARWCEAWDKLGQGLQSRGLSLQPRSLRQSHDLLSQEAMASGLQERKKQRGEKASQAEGKVTERPKCTAGSGPTQSCIYSIYSQALGHASLAGVERASWWGCGGHREALPALPGPFGKSVSRCDKPMLLCIPVAGSRSPLDRRLELLVDQTQHLAHDPKVTAVLNAGGTEQAGASALGQFCGRDPQGSRDVGWMKGWPAAGGAPGRPGPQPTVGRTAI